MNLLLVLSIIWIAFEIVLSRKSKSVQEKENYDGSSLRLLWITLVISISLGIYINNLNIERATINSSFIYYLGLILIASGLVIRFFAILELKNHFTVTISIQNDHKLIRTGIYKHIRHPAYLGSLLSFLGLGFALQNWLSTGVIVVPILAALSYRIFIEEKVLKKEFGEIYSKYKSDTYKIIPWIY